MKRFLVTLMSMFSIILVLSATGFCQNCSLLTGLCFKSGNEAQSPLVEEAQFVPMESVPMESNIPAQGDPVLMDESNRVATVNRRSFFLGRSCTPARSLLAGTSQRIKRLRCR